MPGELEAFRRELRFCFQHSISRVFGTAGLRDNDDQHLRKQIIDFLENAIESVRIGVVEKMDVHAITCRAERVGD